MTNVNPLATDPLNLLHRPKFHGPGQNRLFTTNDGQSERDLGAYSTDGEDGGGGKRAAVNEEQDPDGGVQPDGTHRRLGVLVYGTGDRGEGEDAVPAVGVGYAG